MTSSRRAYTTIFAASGMLLMVGTLLSWWLIFFIHNQALLASSEASVDKFRLERSMRGVVDENVICKGSPGKLNCNIKPEILEKRSEKQTRQFTMLLSETFFVLIILSYGTFRVVRSVNRERELARERTVFLNSVTHELKTPIASVQLALQTLQKRNPSGKIKSDLISEGIAGLRRLNDQVENLLLSGELTRLENTPELQRSNLNEIVSEYLKSRHQELKRKGARISANLSRLPDVKIPVHMFLKILDNLVQNSVNHAGKAPKIELSAISEGGYVILTLCDNGPGVPDSELENIFEPFYRLKNAGSSGSGLGLYLVRQIVTMTGGSVRAYSGEGARFEVRLPHA